MDAKRHTDQMEREVMVPDSPQRIISLVPSQTELLFELGLDDRVVGITKFCVHPKAWFESKTRVGGTKEIKMDRIEALQPDLIIANKEENTRKDVLALASNYPVWVSDVNDLPSAREMIERLGKLTSTEKRADEISAQIVQSFEQLKPLKENPRVLYLIWKNPYMAAGRDTFIHSMLEAIGLENILGASDGRYPALSEKQIKELEPDIILLSSEPFPFKGKHTDEVKASFPNARVLEVDGELFSWYGSRLLKSVKYFQHLQHKF